MGVFTKEWIKASLIRALKTVAQTLAAAVSVASVLSDIDVLTALSMAGVAGLYSILTSIGGLPEVGMDKCSAPAEEK
jgi:hypothetical protein